MSVATCSREDVNGGGADNGASIRPKLGYRSVCMCELCDVEISSRFLLGSHKKVGKSRGLKDLRNS